MFYNEKLYYLLCSCTNPILGKILFLRYRSKYCQPMRLLFFQNKLMIQPHFLHVDTNSVKIKSWLKNYWLGKFENDSGQSGLWTLKLTVSEEWADWFFACYADSQKLKADQKTLGGHSQKWVIEQFYFPVVILKLKNLKC